MFDGLYLLHDEKKDTWQLRLEDSYYCISSVSGLDSIKYCVQKIVKKYRSEFRLSSALSNIDDGGRLGELEYTRQKEQFEKVGGKYKDLLNGWIKETLNEIKMDSVVIKNTRKFKKVNILGDITPTPSLVKESDPPCKAVPLLNGVKLGVKLLKI